MNEQTVKEYQSKVQRAWTAWTAWCAKAKTDTFEERKLYAEYREAEDMYKLVCQTLAETRGENNGS